MPDYYAILHVQPSAPDRLIKMAYKTLMQELGPGLNRNDPEAVRRAQVLNEAWAVLEDPEKRAAYDRERGVRGGNGGYQGNGGFGNNGSTAAESGAAVRPEQRQAAEALGIPAIFRNKLKSGGLGPTMVVIPAGFFLMGSSFGEPGRRESEGSQHFVTFAKPFAIGRYAVTFEEVRPLLRRHSSRRCG